VKEYRLEALRSLFSVMPQNYNRYAFSLRDNVGLSSVCDIDNDDNIIKTLHQAGAKGILEKLTGIDSYLMRIYSDDGFELSGGEWQKIALSRCLFKKAPVVILDEPSSAIDAKSENELFKNIFADQDICGSVLISHRLSNVKDSDQIFVLDKASVVESGSHDELIARRGLYSEMYNLQLKKYL
jgi:ABC-type multidrug transport system fused ATPase/permease subunit